VSGAALSVARKNALMQEAQVNLILMDVLDEPEWNRVPECNLIVSNPPYIPVKEKQQMRENVVNHEPHIALFVADDDPVIFYKKISKLAAIKLSSGGQVFVEMHEHLSDEVVNVFEVAAFTDITVKEDLQGKKRMLRATYNNVSY